jgi:hypothetical protein
VRDLCFSGLADSPNRDFDNYLGAFHRLRLNRHLTLKEADPFPHAENAHPFYGGG